MASQKFNILYGRLSQEDDRAGDCHETATFRRGGAEVLPGGLTRHKIMVPDPLTEFLEDISRQCRFRHWFLGHYHMNGHLQERFIFLYEELVQLTETHDGIE